MSINPDFARVCEEAARAAGNELQGWIGRIEVREKGPADLVTQADFAAQEVVRKTVLNAFPDHDFLGEESGSVGRGQRRSQYRWIVDPLDGTTNFVHGVPHYAVSLALERHGEVLVGTVYDPNSKECFTATAGQGAYLNDRRLRASQVGKLADALAVAGFPPGLQRDDPDLQVFIEATLRCQAVRRTGCSSLNMCYIAAGRFDVYWSFSTKIWDVAAGALIIREAGGTISSPDGGTFQMETGQFLTAANRALLQELLDLVRPVASKSAPAKLD